MNYIIQILLIIIIIIIFGYLRPIFINKLFTESDIFDMYVITLIKKERIVNIKNQEKKIKNKINIFNGVNGLKLNINNLIKKDILDKNYKLSKNINHAKREIGCYLSHLNIYKKIKKDNKKGYTIIFEDDFIVNSSNFKDDVKKAISTLNNYNIDFDFLFLGSNKINYGENIIDKLYYVNPKQNLYGTHAYVINNKNIDKIIDNIKIIKNPIDVIIQDLSKNNIFNTVIMYPYIVIQNKSFKSTVDNNEDVI
jgi:GR25 family glycosyltransferase involved in LPS biosynthesis